MNPRPCLACGRTLRTGTGPYGPRCWAAIRAAQADWGQAQLDKALELIELGGILPTRRPNMWLAVSSSIPDDGAIPTYLAAPQSCTCPAGRHGRRCYHSAAAAVMTAARTPRAARTTTRSSDVQEQAPQHQARAHRRAGGRGAARLRARAAAARRPRVGADARG